MDANGLKASSSWVCLKWTGFFPQTCYPLVNKHGNGTWTFRRCILCWKWGFSSQLVYRRVIYYPMANTNWTSTSTSGRAIQFDYRAKAPENRQKYPKSKKDQRKGLYSTGIASIFRCCLRVVWNSKLLLNVQNSRANHRLDGGIKPCKSWDFNYQPQLGSRWPDFWTINNHLLRMGAWNKNSFFRRLDNPSSCFDKVSQDP